MPSSYLTNQKSRSFLFGNTWFLISPKSSPNNITRVFHAGDRRTPFVGAFSRTPCVHSLMTAFNNLLGRPQLRTATKMNHSAIRGVFIGVSSRPDVSFRLKGLDYYKSGNLRNLDPLGSSIICRNFLNDSKIFKSDNSKIPGTQRKIVIAIWFGGVCLLILLIYWKLGIKDRSLKYSATCYSTGAASEVSFDGVSRDEQSANSCVSSDQKPDPTSTPMKLVSGSCYMPHPEKESTGGEDAHFISTNEHVIGVADGVGGWADLGVNAGHYARELMSNSESAVKDEPKGSVDPARVLEKAYNGTKSRGSSTACIIALNDQGIHAVNLGDSGFIVVREGCTIFRSPAQQHDFNFTYQLESGNGSDLPSSAQVFNFPVAAGDIVIAGTDGLFDNLYNTEMTAVVVHSFRAGLGPQVTAQKVAALARQRALDKNRQTPFSSAAQDAGYRYYGGKLDDITVVVSYITEEK